MTGAMFGVAGAMLRAPTLTSELDFAMRAPDVGTCCGVLVPPSMAVNALTRSQRDAKGLCKAAARGCWPLSASE